MAFGFLVCFLGLLGVTFILISYSNSIVATPYMDEIFHVDQMQRYCAGNFTSWNAKITTPPGLYLFTYIFLSPILLLFGNADVVCSVKVLRFVNCLSTMLLFFVVRGINRTSIGCVISEASAVGIVFLPVLYFTSLLYYTDQLSLLFVLASWRLSNQNRHMWASLCGLVAISMRQTNVVWVGFFAAILTAEELEVNLRSRLKVDAKSAETGSLTRLLSLTQRAWKLKSRWPLFRFTLLTILRVVWPYLLVGFTFAAFIVVNGGIALGDKSAHVAVLHPPQFYYFSVFLLIFGAPYLIFNSSVLVETIGLLLNHKVWSLVGSLLMATSIHFGTHAHPYLLADNRHYTFYIWRRWFMRHTLMKFLPIPVYLFALATLFQSLGHKSQIWKLLFLFCTLAVTVPNRLLEFRYFIVPFVIWRLSVKDYCKWRGRVLLELGYYLLINAVSMVLYWFRPFVWLHEPEDVQRFMW